MLHDLHNRQTPRAPIFFVGLTIGEMLNTYRNGDRKIL